MLKVFGLELGTSFSLFTYAQHISFIHCRFICAEESGATRVHQEIVMKSSSSDTIRTTIYTGRPLRAQRNYYNADYEENRRERINELQSQGKLVYRTDVHAAKDSGKDFDFIGTFPQFMGQAVGGITKVMPAKDIIEEIMTDAHSVLTQMVSRI